VANIVPVGKGVGVHGCMAGWMMSWSVLTVLSSSFTSLSTSMLDCKVGALRSWRLLRSKIRLLGTVVEGRSLKQDFLLMSLAKTSPLQSSSRCKLLKRYQSSLGSVTGKSLPSRWSS
jgi:hypothetical protein